MLEVSLMSGNRGSETRGSATDTRHAQRAEAFEGDGAALRIVAHDVLNKRVIGGFSFPPQNAS